MKRTPLLRLLRRNGCVLKREGARHSLWTNPCNGVVEASPRHNEIPDILVKKILKRLEVAAP